MTAPSPKTSIAEIERRVLRALCGGEISESDWLKIEKELASYTWRDPDHAVVYQAMARARKRDPRNWREQLPAQATLMGFPELDWNAFLARKESSDPGGELRELIGQLKAS